ncbi:MAG: hypothetical protein UT34_C0001G0235 [candidate division WS6 bacterium GW2011_GWF2_39_15]|uniref:peptidoglycan glycosyltransferase n=1 Tax=candidate division WS6 bacterium GW2011_GWF2_39_15 TaxID=1619100 RepID=A0A0G0Q701_9BACT|nr:MAG: hypothetical protein UT34_C0001G0235 [candidate division WS6 bacterium GW2011_GWF2_39_15]
MKYRVGLTDRKPVKPNFQGYNRRVSGSKAYASSVRNLKRYGSRVTPSQRIAANKKGKGSSAFKKKLLKATYIFIGICFFVGLFLIIGAGIYLKQLEASLPDPNKLVDRSSALSTQILDRNGKLLYTIHGDQNREFVKLEEIPEYTKWALLAAEDVDFYQHKGIDIIAILRSAYNTYVLNRVMASGSTISQQLVKTTLLYDILGVEAYDKTISRKIKEILITMQMEQAFSKDDILQMYMNEVPLGGVNYGFQAAANAYFGKDVKDLSLAESALIAGLIQRPGYSSPLFGTNPEEAKLRQSYVLDQMLKHKDLTGVTEEEIDKARNEPLVYTSKEININAPHFVFYVKQLLADEFGLERVEQGGLKVTTTLDLSIQKIAEEEVRNGIRNLGKKWNVNNGALVSIDPRSGDIIAMVGSVDYNKTNDKRIDGNVNVTISPRQMGSSVKPYTYLTAFNQGYGPWLLVPDVKGLNFGNYKLENWDNKYSGLLTARQGLLQSRNIPAVYTMQLVGIDNFIKTAETLGITTLTHRDQYGLSLTLGTAEMSLVEHAGAFTVFANEGIKKDIRSILKVEDSKGNVLLEKKENKGKRVWDEREIYALNWILCDLGGFRDQPNDKYYYYNGRRAYCGKTGTTNGPKDLVSIMYSKSLLTAVWSGNNNNIETPGAWSTTVPLPIASSFMNRVASKYKPVGFSRPSGIIATSVCADTGNMASKDSNCKKVPSIYISGKAPKPDKRTAVEVCKVNKKKPTNLESAKKYGLTTTVYVIEKQLENKLQQAYYEKYLSSIKGSSALFKEPESADCPLPLGPGDAPIVDILTPASGATIAKNSTVTIKVDPRAKGNVTSVDLYFDGDKIQTINAAPYEYGYNIPNSTSVGTHVIKAVVHDDEGKTGESQINVSIISNGITVSISSPTNGASFIVQPINITAALSDDDVEKVQFVITKNGGGFSTTLEDNSVAGGWSVSWNDGTLPGVNTYYSVKAVAIKGGNNYESSSITIKY